MRKWLRFQAQWVKDVVLLWLGHRLAAAAPIPPLPWEPPYATGAALKSKKKKKKKKSFLNLFNLLQWRRWCTEEAAACWLERDDSTKPLPLLTSSARRVCVYVCVCVCV